VVSAQRDVTVAEQEARAAVARADGEAGAIRKIAEANAARETLVGMAQAGVLEAKVNAIGRDNWTTMGGHHATGRTARAHRAAGRGRQWRWSRWR
jgi:hypothetical protein